MMLGVGIGGDMHCSADLVFFVTDWRRIQHLSLHACGCCWLKQRRCDDCFGLCKIVWDCCVDVACVRAADVYLIDCVAVIFEVFDIL